MIYIFGLPAAVLAALWLGRCSMRRTWRLDLPYNQRPVWPSRYGGQSIPIVPNGRWL